MSRLIRPAERVMARETRCGAVRHDAVPPRGRLRLQSASIIMRLDVPAGVMRAE